MIPTTTLAQIRKHDPCVSGWRKLVKNLGGLEQYGEDTPLTILQILDSNGLDGALWCLSICPNSDTFARTFARWCALQVIDLWHAPDVAREYLLSGNENLRIVARDAVEAVATREVKQAGDAKAVSWSAIWAADTRSDTHAATRNAARRAAWAVSWAVSWIDANAAWADMRAAQAKHLREMCAENIQ